MKVRRLNWKRGKNKSNKDDTLVLKLEIQHIFSLIHCNNLVVICPLQLLLLVVTGSEDFCLKLFTLSWTREYSPFICSFCLYFHLVFP